VKQWKIKDILNTGVPKQASLIIFIYDKAYFKLKLIKRDKEDCQIWLK
jgi:hypothetical protein